MKQELGPNQKAWLADLRSGRFAQGKFRLRTGDAYCCLGVGCRTAQIACHQITDHWGFDGSIWAAPRSLMDFLALHGEEAHLEGASLRGNESLIEANDAGVLFSEIADFCEAHPEAVFVEPR